MEGKEIKESKFTKELLPKLSIKDFNQMIIDIKNFDKNNKNKLDILFIENPIAHDFIMFLNSKDEEYKKMGNTFSSFVLMFYQMLQIAGLRNKKHFLHLLKDNMKEVIEFIVSSNCKEELFCDEVEGPSEWGDNNLSFNEEKTKETLRNILNKFTETVFDKLEKGCIE